jgi:hypothetical protein
VIGIIRRDRGASALIYTTRSCGETRSLFFCQNRSEQNSLAVLLLMAICPLLLTDLRTPQARSIAPRSRARGHVNNIVQFLL